jgi:glycosyltransferase involved in cell wall biosynthesis
MPAAGPRRVLVVTPWWPREERDPFGSFVRDQALALEEEGADVRAVVVRLVKPGTRGDGVAPLARGRVSLVRGAWAPHRLAYPQVQAALGRAVRRGVSAQGTWARGAVALVHTQDLAVPARRALRGSGVPFVVVAHGLEPDSPRYRNAGLLRSYRRAIETAARVVAVGPGLAAALSREAPRADVRTVLNGHDRRLVLRVRAEPARGDGVPCIVSVSNLVEGKGVDLTLDALARRRERRDGSPLRYDVVGDGPERGRLEALARRLPAGSVVFHGALPRADALRVVRGATAFVLPSAPEACGIAYLEAMALGVPPVAVRGEGPSAFVSDGEDGLLVPRTADAVADAIDRLAGDPALAARLGAAAAERARGLDWGASARALLEALPERAPDPVPAARTARRPWLALYEEPTPYVTALLDAVEARGAPVRRAWAAVDSSQRWGSDAPFREEDVLRDARRVARTAGDLVLGRYAGVCAGGWGGRRTTPLLLAAAWMGRRPLVIESDTHASRSRGARAWVRRAWLRLLDRRVRAWVPGGTPQAAHLAAAASPRAPVVVEGMTTDTTTLLAEAERAGPDAGRRWREEHGVPAGARLVLYVGRLAPEKGVDDLVEAVARLVASGLDVHLALLGPGSLDAAGRGAGPASSRLPAERLHAPGRVPWRALVPAYLAADVLALPSRSEPWGLVVNEALLLGCPVVVSEAVGAGPDLVAAPGAGIVVPAGRPEALESGLRAVLEAGGRESEHAARGREVMRDWTTERAAERRARVLLGGSPAA